MANDPPNLNDINARITYLQEQLSEATDPYKQMPLLDELSFHFRLIDAAEAGRYAREELRIASAIKDKHWMMRSYVRLGNSARSQSHYAFAWRYFTYAWKLLEELPDDPAEKAYVRRNMGNILFETGKTQAGLEIYESSLQFARESGDQREIAATLDSLSLAYVALGFYSKGLILRKEALEIFEGRSFNSGIGISLSAIGEIYAFLEDWETALSHHIRGLTLHQQVGNKDSEVQSRLEIGTIYAYQGRFIEGLESCNKALELSEKIGNAFLWGQAQKEIGRIRILQGAYKEGFSHLKEAEQRFQSIGNTIGKGLVLLEMGEAFIAQQKWSKAIAVLLEAFEILGTAKLRTYMMRLERLLAHAYEQNSNLEKSLHHYKRFIELEHSLLDHEIRHELAFHQFKDQVRTIEDEKENYRAKASQLEQRVQERSKEVTFLSLRIGQDDELLKQLRRRLRDLKHANGETVALINALIRDIDDRVEHTNAWSIFRKELEGLDGEFVRKLTTSRFDLTRSEIRICLLLKLNMSNKEIGMLLSIAERTVDTHRTNIRKKLRINTKENLVAALSRI